MNTIIHVIEFIFGMSLFVNILLYIPQIATMIRANSAEGVSAMMFIGFLFIQFITVLHGIINHDAILAIGFVGAMIPTAIVVTLAVYYKRGAKRSMIIQTATSALQTDESN